MVKKATASIVLDTRRKKIGDVYPVKIRVIYDRANKLYSTVFDLSKEDFGKVMGQKPRGQYLLLRRKLDAIIEQSLLIIDELHNFSFDLFADKFLNKRKEKKDVFGFYDNYISFLEKEERIGSAISYRCSLNALKKFHSKDVLMFYEVDVTFLKRFENWSVSQGNSLTTIGIYLRCLRTIYNQGIKQKAVLSEDYPFGRGNYVIPTPANVKKALTLKEIQKIFEYSPKSSVEGYYRDLWLFSYLCNGANIKDVCLLKHKDLSGGTVIFRRSKTSSTNRKSRPITAAYTNEIETIVKKWAKSFDQNDFVFPVLSVTDNEKRVKEKVGLVVKQINKYMRHLCEELGIENKITTYTARHSFATVLKRSGVNTSFITDFLGHSSQKTTEAYLGSIETDEIHKIAKHLTKFT